MAVEDALEIVLMYAVELVVIFVTIVVSGLLQPVMVLVRFVMDVVLLVAVNAQNNVVALVLLVALDALVIVLILVEMAARVALVHVVENVKINVALVQDVMDALVLALEVALDLVQDAIAAQEHVNLIVLVVLLHARQDVRIIALLSVYLVVSQIVTLLVATVAKAM